VKVRTFAGPKKQLGAQPKGANKAMEAQYGPSGDLILALPLVLQNLTKYSTAITASQSPGAKVGGYNGRRFGNAAADAALLLDNTAGFFAKLGSDPSAAALGVAAKCPAGSTAVIKDCLELALCACQSSLESQPNKKKSAKTYAMLEQVSAGFKDINFGLLDASLKTEATPGASFMEVYKHTDSFLEASAYTCPLKKSTARALLQEDEHTEVRAAAYHTSAVLEAAAEVTHTILDSHGDNSSAEATLEALHQAWKPSCELLDCDHTNYYDLFGASHSHSLALIEAGASLQHMRTHIRIRHRLDVRMNRFLSEHGTKFQKDGVLLMYQTEGTRTEAKIRHYYDELRDAIGTFAEAHAATKSEDDLMMLIGSEEKIKDFYLSQNGVDTDIAEEHQDQLEDPVGTEFEIPEDESQVLVEEDAEEVFSDTIAEIEASAGESDSGSEYELADWKAKMGFKVPEEEEEEDPLAEEDPFDSGIEAFREMLENAVLVPDAPKPSRFEEMRKAVRTKGMQAS